MSGSCKYWTYDGWDGGVIDAPEVVEALLVLLQEAWSARRDAHVRAQPA